MYACSNHFHTYTVYYGIRLVCESSIIYFAMKTLPTLHYISNTVHVLNKFHLLQTLQLSTGFIISPTLYSIPSKQHLHKSALK